MRSRPRPSIGPAPTSIPTAIRSAKGVGGFDDCALTVLTTVVSRPTPTRAVIDAGSKTLTSDTLGLEGFGRVTEYPDARIRSLSEEHGVIDLDAGAAPPSASGCASSPTTPVRCRTCLTS